MDKIALIGCILPHSEGRDAVTVVWGDEQKGWPSKVFPVLVTLICDLYDKGNTHFKIGITNNPQRRWAQAYGGYGWGNMHVIYESSSLDHTRDLERWLIESFDEKAIDVGGYYYNATGGGGGRRPLGGPYYVYCVSAPPYSRIRIR
jgi:hypothetical protein